MKIKILIVSALLLTFLSSCKNCEAKKTSNPAHVKQLLTTKKCPKCDLGGADLTNADLAGADLREAELTDAKLDGANLQGSDLRQAEMRWTDKSEDDHGESGFSEIGDIDFSCNVDYKVSLEKVNFQSVKLSGTNLSGLYISHSNLHAADLSSANLKGTYFTKVDLSQANLNHANLAYTTFRDGNFHSANLQNTDLSHSIFTVDLGLTDVDMSGAILKFAKLDGNDLRGANLRDVDFTQSSVDRTDFRHTKNLTTEQIKLAQNWEEAVYDEEFRAQLGLPACKTKLGKYLGYPFIFSKIKKGCFQN
ncbi:MAG: pentapeptide repeat-containing protein [Nostoc sp.]|uniref:pentapeptide repeat-containing protein n=1 Tax=Nostoc sp. TaxID=1180 RepID=UPI002FF68F66